MSISESNTKPSTVLKYIVECKLTNKPYKQKIMVLSVELKKQVTNYLWRVTTIRKYKDKSTEQQITVLRKIIELAESEGY